MKKEIPEEFSKEIFNTKNSNKILPPQNNIT